MSNSRFKKNKIKYLIFLFINIGIIPYLHAQSIPIGQIGTDDILRTSQLLGKINHSYSLTIKPIYYNKVFNKNNYLNIINASFFKADSIYAAKKNLQILPLTFNNKFNSHHPYGWNDGPMIMAKGLQTNISSGIFYKAGPISFQLQPEFTYSQNTPYDTSQYFGYNSRKSTYRFWPGQTYLKFNIGALSFGASTENLWWGPGQFSSLNMSNNAPGFSHLTFNTSKPLQTAIGSFEWQLIVGILDEDTTVANEAGFMRPLQRKKESRYYNGVVVSYQPKWMKGFFLGVTRMLQFYTKDIENRKKSFVKKYLPVLASSNSTDNFASNIDNPDDGAVSLFVRWVLPKHNAEFYLEYGYNDYKAGIRDFTLNANHASAYIAGFKKVVTLNKNNILDISGELTQMAQTTSYLNRYAGNWYNVGGNVYEGYTFQNQVLGAGSGVGNNLQTLQLKKIKGFDQIGFKFTHIQQDPKGLVGASSNSMGVRAIQWNDWSLGFLGQKRWNKLVLNAEMQFVYSKNYGWGSSDKFNLFATFNGLYFF